MHTVGCGRTPDLLPQVLGPDTDKVLVACQDLVDDAQMVFNTEISQVTGSSLLSAAQRKNCNQTKTFMGQMLGLLKEKLVTEPTEPNPPQKSTLWLRTGGPQDHHALRHLGLHMRWHGEVR